MISEEKFYDRASKFALLKNTDGKYFTLDEYEKLIKENQTNNNKTLVYLYASDKDVQHSFIEEAKAIGLFSGDVGSEKEILQTIRDSNYTHNELINEIHSYAHDFSDSVAKENIDINIPIEENSALGDLFAKLSQSNPVYYYLTNKILESFGSIVIPQNDPEYQAIANIYNGKGLYEQFVKTSFDGTNSVFSLVDEAGDTIFWKYPEYNTYVVVPPLYGTWVGINSPNNQTPLRGFVDGMIRESWLDKCAFMHDNSYHDNSSFNKTGDYQLISRISQNLDLLVLPGEKQVGLIAVNYFSSLGALTRKLMGPAETDPIVKDLFKDVYNAEVSTDELETFINHKRIPTDTNSQLASLINNLDLELD
jgi:hypothetical protein